jgi:hypothetical protein
MKKIGADLLFHAVSTGDVHNMIALIEEQEADVNSNNINGQTALHVSLFLPIYHKYIKTFITIANFAFLVCC